MPSLDRPDRSASNSPDLPFAPGEVFAHRYRMVTRLGRGDTGDVWRADDLVLGIPVALKLMRADGAEERRRLFDEVRLARARQLLWLPTTREEKYKAKQAIDTFFVRGGDVLSAAAVYIGTGIVHLSVAQFAGVNVALTLAWLTVAARIAYRRLALPHIEMRRVAAAAAAVTLLALAAPASAQDTREAQLAAERAEKATRPHP